MHTGGSTGGVWALFWRGRCFSGMCYEPAAGVVVGYQSGADFCGDSVDYLALGQGAYCGWICSCGALAETMGDMHRQKMPHGPVWNRMNMVGQVILVLAFVLLALRIAGWLLPYHHWVNAGYMGLFMGKDVNWGGLIFPLTFLNYQWFVDLFLAGIIGVGFLLAF